MNNKNYGKGRRVVAIDADDTLWENEPLFREAERKWAELLRDHGTLEELSARLYEVESGNMGDLGYGAKAFTLSLFEAALKITGGKMDGTVAAGILEAGYSLLHNPATPMDGVEETLRSLSESGKYRLVMVTKGDLLDQQHKIERSGLGKYFDRIMVVSNKSAKEYLELCEEMGIEPSELTSVGNSLKSDVKPVIDIGGRGVYVPYRITWEHEKIDEFVHPRLTRIEKFSQLLGIL